MAKIYKFTCFINELSAFIKIKTGTRGTNLSPYG